MHTSFSVELIICCLSIQGDKGEQGAKGKDGVPGPPVSFLPASIMNEMLDLHFNSIVHSRFVKYSIQGSRGERGTKGDPGDRGKRVS